MGQFFQLFVTLLPIPLFLFWMWMFSDMLKNDDIPTALKQQWLLAFIFLNIFGAILYYFNVYRHNE